MSTIRTLLITLTIALSLSSLCAPLSSQTLPTFRLADYLPGQPHRSAIYDYTPAPGDTLIAPLEAAPQDTLFFIDELLADTPDAPLPPSQFVYIPYTILPRAYVRPAVFDKIHLIDPLTLTDTTIITPDPTISPSLFKWINEDALRTEIIRRARQHYLVYNPGHVRYIESQLPEPPRKFTARVDPASARIVLAEAPKTNNKPELKATYAKRHWVHAFNINLQFSQAYVSPNWYQGGNSNINGLFTSYYNVKLNPAFHPKTLFDVTAQYKLGANNAQNDTLRGYSISEDLLQINFTAGYKANRRWYYSMNGQFKTQFLSNYQTNTQIVKAAFMAPAEANVGVGMTYNYANTPRSFTLDASINPISWNYKMCLDHRLQPSWFGIQEGRTLSQIGSSAEGRITWRIFNNINLRSRLFIFTNWEYAQSDWENTLMFTINRYLTTQIYAHLRYDSTTKQVEDWHKFQFREVLSFGFTYKFNS